jgi:deoxyribonuclease I
MKYIFYLAVFLSFVSLSHAAQTITFARAKTIANNRLFTGDLRVDYYCSCKYNDRKEILWDTCGYKPRLNPTRGKRLEWEHVVPAFYYTRKLPCGRRARCEKVSPEFQRFEGDLHNLRPTVGELNADRSDKLYGVVTTRRDKNYGRCTFYTNTSVAEPPDKVKGDLARITLYMNQKYNLVLPYDYLKLMDRWSKDDPVNDAERTLNQRIKVLQGDANPFVK